MQRLLRYLCMPQGIYNTWRQGKLSSVKSLCMRAFPHACGKMEVIGQFIVVWKAFEIHASFSCNMHFPCGYSFWPIVRKRSSCAWSSQEGEGKQWARLKHVRRIVIGPWPRQETTEDLDQKSSRVIGEEVGCDGDLLGFKSQFGVLDLLLAVFPWMAQRPCKAVIISSLENGEWNMSALWDVFE